MEGFLENGDVIKTYTLSQWDDYGFNGWINNAEGIKKISFEFETSIILSIISFIKLR